MKKPYLDRANPELVDQWHPTLNERDVWGVTTGSNYKAWWKCPEGHTYQARVSSRARGSGCRVCANLEVLPGFNDFTTTHPELVREWHPTKNTIDPTTITYGSDGKKVWWLGECGHEWETMLTNRTSSGDGCPVCSGHLLIQGVNDLASVRPDLAKEWHPDKNKGVSPTEVTSRNIRRVWWLGDCGHEWVAEIRSRVVGRGCRRCNGGKRSKGERDLYEYVLSLASDAVHTYCDVPGWQVDIFVPSKNVGVEYNGLYWHSDKIRPKRYHRNKHRAMQEHGVRIVEVWEDDWRDRQEIVKKMIARKLGVSQEERVNARSLAVTSLSKHEACKFLEGNHIQGFTPGSFYLALRDHQVRAVLVGKKRGSGVYEISRYASSAIVRGGFTRLMNNAERLYPVTQWVTFADRSVSDGGLYENLGFEKDGELEPDYAYLVGRSRVHKFNYRKSRFKSDPKLKYESGLTEKELAELNNIPRVWDSGKVRYVKNTP